MKLMIAAGGTGGHVAPGLAVARQWIESSKQAQVVMVGSMKGIEKNMAEKQGLAFESVPASPLYRPLWDPRNLWMPFKVLAGVLTSMELIESHRPAALLATGGWVSIPVGLAARLKGIPLILHESNAWPGLANRLLSKIASHFCLAYEEAARSFESDKVTVTGNPSRLLKLPSRSAARKKLGFDRSSPLVLVMPGSGAASSINECIARGLDSLKQQVPRMQLLWMTGQKEHEIRRSQAARFEGRVQARPFIDDVANAYAAADLVLCRAGSATLAELAALGKASVLVPYPFATGNHQARNAEAFEKAGAAVVISQSDVELKLVSKIASLLKSPAKLAAMAKKAAKLGEAQAARKIVEVIAKHAQGKS